MLEHSVAVGDTWGEWCQLRFLYMSLITELNHIGPTASCEPSHRHTDLRRALRPPMLALCEAAARPELLRPDEVRGPARGAALLVACICAFGCELFCLRLLLCRCCPTRAQTAVGGRCRCACALCSRECVPALPHPLPLAPPLCTGRRRRGAHHYGAAL